MSYTPQRSKQPNEARYLPFDFGSKVASGDAVSAVVGSALIVPSGITAGAPSISGNIVTALVSGGTALTSYRISCRVTTTLGETLELDVDLYVAEGIN